MERILARRQFMRVLTATGLSAAFAGSLLDRALAAHGGPRTRTSCSSPSRRSTWPWTPTPKASSAASRAW